MRERLIERVISGEDVTLDGLDALKVAALDILGEEQQSAGPMKSDEMEALLIALDALAAMAVLDSSDPAIPWNRGHLAARFGFHTEAATDFVESARRSRLLLESGQPEMPDEGDWARDSLDLACDHLLQADRGLTAAVTLKAMDAEAVVRRLHAALKSSRRSGGSNRGTGLT